MFFTVTVTTRKQRPGEIDGFHYHLLHPRAIRATTLRRGIHRVGGGLRQLLRRAAHPHADRRSPAGQDVVVKVDTQGAQTFHRLAPGGIFIFIAPPSIEELARRLHHRKTDDEAALARRLRTAQRELATVEHFDYVVFNESGQEDDTVRQIIGILTAERCRLHQTGVEL